MARTGRAAGYEAPNTSFIIKEYPLRDPQRGEVLVRNTMSTICRSDIHSWEGRRPNPCPGILGHEIIGVPTPRQSGIRPADRTGTRWRNNCCVSYIAGELPGELVLVK